MDLYRGYEERRDVRHSLTNIARPAILIFGRQQITVDTASDLLGLGLDVAAIVTQQCPHDGAQSYARLRDLTSDHDIPLLEPQSVDHAGVDTIRQLRPDLIISAYYRNILPREVLNIPRLGCINVHPGRLPYYRGPIPTFWALVNGEKSCGVTLHYMDEGIDTGDIIAQEQIPITNRDTGFTLSARAMRVGHSLLMRNIEAVMKGEADRRPQDPREGSYFGSFNERLRYVDWRKGSRAVYNHVRALTRPYAGALAVRSDRQILIWKVRELEREYSVAVPPGRIRHVSADGSFIVATSDGCVAVTDYEVVAGASGESVGDVIKVGKTLC